MEPQSTEKILAWLEEAKGIVCKWQFDLEQLHKIYKTKPSARLDKVSTVAYHILQYMQVLSIQALLGTTTSKMSEVLSQLDPEVLLLLSRTEK